MRRNFIFKCLLWPLLLLAVLFVPAIDVLLFFSGILIAWYTAKYGVQYTAFALPLLFFAGFFADGLPTALLIGTHSISAYVIGFFLNKRKGFSLMLMISTLIEAAVLTAFTLFACNLQQCTPAELLFSRPLQQFSDILLSSGVGVATETASDMRLVLQYFSQMLQTLLPFLYLFVSLVYVYIVFAITRFCLKKQGNMIDSMPFFHELRISGSISLIFVFLFLLSMFSTSPVLLNVTNFVFMLHVVCGMSAVDAFLIKKGVRKGFRILLLAVLLAISSFLGGIFLAMLCFMGMSRDVQGVRK